MELHGLGVGEGKRKLGADDRRCRSADRRVGAAAFLAGPLPHEAVFLADAGLILEPDFD
jgi:hypothetical protein